MDGIMIVASVLCAGALSACTASDIAVPAPKSAADARAAIEARPPSEEGLMDLLARLETFSGSARVDLAGDDPAGPVPVAERLTAGFQQDPPRRLRLDNGSTIYWGWQEGQAFIRSIAIYDGDGNLRMAGAVDNLPNLRPRSGDAIRDSGSYKRLLVKKATWGSSPSTILFVKDEQALRTYYPLARRWIQAAMLGFDAADCGGSQAHAVCGFVTQISVPTAVYSLNCTNELVNRCPLAIPKLEAADVPLQKFRQ